MRVLLGGGSGFIGKHLLTLLQRKGHDVTVISRTSGSDRITWDDLKSKGLPEDCGAVVNLAGENIVNPNRRWNDSFKSDLISSRTETNRQMVDAIVAAKSRPKVWISASAKGYYPPSRTAVYTEDSPGGKSDFLAHLSFEAEKSSALPPSITDVRHVTVRIGIVLGRDGGPMERLLHIFSLGLGGRFGSGKQWFPWIHVDDMVGIIAHAIENEKTTGVLNGVAPECVTNAEFTSTLAKSFRRPALLPIPGFVLRLLNGDDLANGILESQHIVPKRTLESGYKFLFPDLRSACKSFVKK